MKNKKYTFHYGDSILYWLNAKSIGGVISQLNKKGMTIPDCIESIDGIWYKEDHIRD